MRWQGRRRSSNVEDRRRLGGGTLAVGGGAGGLVILLLFILLGGDPRILLQGGGSGPLGQLGESMLQSPPPDAAEDQLADFVSVVLADTEDVWHDQFRQMGRTYQPPKLVLFSDYVGSACGSASSAVGPFYCPLDRQVYIDLRFYRDLRERFAAPGDLAQAYVVAHEVGHHVQNLLGISDQVQSARGRVSEAEYNRLSQRLELQADYFAGLWVHHAQREQQILEPGDIDEALNAAAAIGDDRIQMQTQGRVVPDSFTHGTSAQRVYWFKRGVESGRMEDGDTFAITEP